ncbi:hypothetical protein G6O67_003188 [Ophiocordyceps sinensis]|uniref:Nnf1 n=1 Tax=Ophiocordyceps sinensis TaxID=72228 RepID=A0A8H4V819_9HYPO|nr:hypothetical protein G6O67_003188 [Ophiocordyceps sinensis]
MASPPRRASPAAGDEAPAQHAGASEPQEPQDDDAAPQTPDDAAPQTPDDAAPRQQEGGPGTDSAKGHGDGDPRQDAPAPPPRPGPRAARLRETYAHALRRTLAKLAAWEHFAGCYPTVADRAEGVLRQVQAQMVDKMGDKCEKEFDNILAARAVVPRLNELEALVADAAERRDSSHGAEPTPPHLLPPSHVLAAHLAAHLAPHRSLLNAKLQTTQAQNALLADAVARQRAELDALLARLDDAVADVRGANQALGGLADELADEARAAAVDDGP